MGNAAIELAGALGRRRQHLADQFQFGDPEFLVGAVLGRYRNALPGHHAVDRAGPEVGTYAALDAALDQELLLPLGAMWRYFPGHAAPAPKREWAQPEFDDSAWQIGPSPLGFGHEDNATALDELEPAFTTLYLRTVLHVEDPAIFERSGSPTFSTSSESS